MPYPTYLELAEFCVDAGLIEGFPTDYAPYETAIAAAVSTWEQRTGWRPFLAPAEDETKIYREWQPAFLDLKGGFVSITSVTYDDEATPGTVNLDYDLKPDGGSPTRWLKLWRLPSRRITVVGKPGYATECPDDVRRALLAYGAAQVATLLNGTGQVVSIKQGDVQYTYAPGGADNPTTQYAQWTLELNQAVKAYSRRSFA